MRCLYTAAWGPVRLKKKVAEFWDLLAINGKKPLASVIKMEYSNTLIALDNIFLLSPLNFKQPIHFIPRP